MIDHWTSLRPYQQQCVEAVLASWQNHNRVLAVSATGTGKTRIGAYIAWAWNDLCTQYHRSPKVLWLAGREELLFQAAEALEFVTGEAVGLEKAQSSVHRKHEGVLVPYRIVVASIQTMMSEDRRRAFADDEFGLVVVDEAHHVIAEGHAEVVEHFVGGKVLGLTATPNRTDECSLGQIFEDNPFYYYLSDAITDGWLAPVRQQFAHVEDLDFSHVKLDAKGELSESQLEAIILQERPLHAVCAALAECSGDRPTIAFVPGVAVAVAVANMMNDRYSSRGWRAVSGTAQHKDTRADDIKAAKEGKIQGLVNAQILTEGVDWPACSHIFLGRPIRSRLVVEQMIGRGLRGGPRAPVPGKTDLLVTDLTGSNCHHKLIRVSDVLGGKLDAKAVDAAHRNLEHLAQAGTPGDVMDELRKAAELLDELTRQHRMRVLATARIKRTTVDPFDLLDLPERVEPNFFLNRAPSDDQVAILKSYGVNPDGMTQPECRRLIKELAERRARGLCTYKQARKLVAWGYDPNCTFDEASEILTALASKNWKRDKRDAIRWAKRKIAIEDRDLVLTTERAQILRGKRGAFLGLQLGPPEHPKVIKGRERARRLFAQVRANGVTIDDPMPPPPKTEESARGAGKRR